MLISTALRSEVQPIPTPIPLIAFKHLYTEAGQSGSLVVCGSMWQSVALVDHVVDH